MCSDFVQVDRRGDLTLQVGRGEAGTGDASWPHADFLVCSRTLARASPVFDRMLYGPFVEANKHSNNDNGQTGWTVALKQDKPAPMQVFLNIAHANIALVPHVLSVDNLYDLAVLTNYYDATALLAPWIDVWMAATAEVARDANLIQPKLLWIFWEFGRKDDFRLVAHRMLMEEAPPPSERTDEGDEIQAPHIIARIDAIRSQTIQKLLDIVRDVTDRLTVVDEGPRWCRHASRVRHHQCESMALGSITFCLARAGLWPLPETVVGRSLADLDRVMATMVVHDIGETTDEPRVDHGPCNPRPMLMQRVEQVMRGIPSPLAEFHGKYLEERAVQLRHGPAK